jgi:hypothetical protein
MQYWLSFPFLLVASVLLVACGDPSVGHSDGGGFLRDTGSAMPPPMPRLDAVSTPVPWPVATLRGTAAMADRVIVEGGGNPIASAVLPDGTFCVDVPMPSPATYELSILSQRDGLFSRTPATTSVVFDPAAPAISGATTCSGTSPAGCIGAVEICDNSIDDDCNGLRDDRDPACASCADDVLEPNDEVTAPRIEPGRYDDLQICPSNSDYYGIFLRAGDTLTVRLFFSHAGGDIDLQLIAPDETTVLERSVSVTDDEMIMYAAPSDGERIVRVYGLGGAMNTYALDVQVD